MSIALARSRYRQAQSANAAEVDNPHEIILVTLLELERSLSVLATSFGEGVKAPDEHTSRALTAIYILQSSLDFEKGGDIATSLFQLYEYSRQQILALMRRDPEAQIVAARDCISDVMSAWRQIGPEVGGKPS